MCYTQHRTRLGRVVPWKLPVFFSEVKAGTQSATMAISPMKWGCGETRLCKASEPQSASIKACSREVWLGLEMCSLWICSWKSAAVCYPGRVWKRNHWSPRGVRAETIPAQQRFVKFLSLLFQSLQLRQWETAVFRFSAKLKSLIFPSPQKFNLRFNETFNLKQYILICREAIFWIKVNKVINYLLFFNLESFSRAISWIQGETNVWAPM